MTEYLVRCEVLDTTTFEPVDIEKYPPIEVKVFATTDERAREEASAIIPFNYEFLTVVSYLRYKEGSSDELVVSLKKWQETEYIDANLNKSIVKRVRIRVPRGDKRNVDFDEL